MTTENTDKGQTPTEADSQGHCALGDGSPLLQAWADECGIDISDDRVIYGWPEKFRYFKNGWEAALKISVTREDMRAAMTALALEKDDKIDALRTELTATRMACEDWIKIANAGANDTARQLERETATLHAQIARLKQREGELEMLLEGGAGRIARERHRHVTQEGYDAAHDDEHTYGTIRVVAAMLACNGTDASVSDPLDRDDWNLGRHPLERRLEIAWALLAAELDRLARAALQSLRALTEQPGKP